MMKEKLNSRKGFTLAELLIVVAIIAILIAIMVPVFGTSRANAAQAKDASNVRSGYSEAVTNAMAENKFDGTGKLTVDLDTFFASNPVKLDSATKVTVNEAKTEITIKTEKATGDGEKITVDSDIALTFSGLPKSDS